MAVYKRGQVWWYKFTWNGEAIRESTKQSNKRIAEQIQATHRASLAIKARWAFVNGSQLRHSARV